MVKFRMRTKIMAVVTFLVMSAAVIFGGYDMQNAEATGGTDYVKYTFATGQTQTYNLPDIPTVNRSSYAMRAMQNDDPRPPADLDTATVKITSKRGTFDVIGTGFIIGDHEIMTAAHVAYQFGYPMTVTIPDANPYTGNAVEFDIVAAHVPQAYIDYLNTHNTVSQNVDYAILTVEEDLSSYGCFLLGMGTDVAQTNNVTFYSHGYSGNTLKLSSGTISGANEESYNFSIISRSGSSGGPVFAKSAFGVPGVTSGEYKIQTYRTVVAIVSSTPDDENMCTARIRPIIMQFAYDNNYL